MQVSATAKYIRMSPRKVRLVADVVRGLDVRKALAQLDFSRKHAALPIRKLVGSAVANAEHNFNLAKENLFIKEIKVDGGPTLKRWMPRAHGRATPLKKRTSHISLVLSEIVDSGEREGRKPKSEKPISLDAKPKETKESSTKVEAAPKTPGRGADAPKKKEIIDPRSEGKGKHAKIEGKAEKGIVGRMFRRKSG